MAREQRRYPCGYGRSICRQSARAFAQRKGGGWHPGTELYPTFKAFQSDHAAAAITMAGMATVFAWRGETLPEYWWCTEQMMKWPGVDGCDQLVDDGGDATLLIHKGKQFEVKYAKDGSLPDLESTTNPEFKCILQLLKDSILADKAKFSRMAAKCTGINEMNTTGVHRLKASSFSPAINVNDCVLKRFAQRWYIVKVSAI